MKFVPYEYQSRAIQFVIDNPAAGLFLDMGLGKSVITLTAVQQLMITGEVSRALVVAPKKVAESTWSDEADKWDHLRGLRVSRVMGTEVQRRRALSQEADVYVVNRDNFVWLTGVCNGVLPFDMLIIDELTSFKSSKSQRFKAMRLVRPGIDRVVGLTGTPAPNGYIDLWAQIYCLDMGERLGKSVTRYRQEYFNEHRWNNIVVRSTIKSGCEEIIRDRIADICLTMQSRDYLQLPEMIVHTVPVCLPDKMREAYKVFERDRVLEFRDAHAGESSNLLVNSAAGLMNKLSQFANGAVYDEDGGVHDIHGEKVDTLAEIVEGATGGVLVFYQFKHDVPRIMAKLKGRRVEVYRDERQLREWNAGNIDVLLAHPASTAYGLNMQAGGHYIVWFGTGWDLELYMQANARLHRQGQRYPVMVYKLVTSGTIDELANSAMEGKRSKQQCLLDSLSKLIHQYSA